MSPDTASLDNYKPFAARKSRKVLDWKASLDNRDWKPESPVRRDSYDPEPDVSVNDDWRQRQDEDEWRQSPRKQKLDAQTVNWKPSLPEVDKDYNSLDDYKHLSAQDFRKTIMAEERLALGKDDESMLSRSEDLDRKHDFDNESDMFSLNSYNDPAPNHSNGSEMPRLDDDKPRHGSQDFPTFQPATDFKLEEIIALRQSATNGSNQEQLSKEVDDELMKVPST